MRALIFALPAQTHFVSIGHRESSIRETNLTRTLLLGKTFSLLIPTVTVSVVRGRAATKLPGTAASITARSKVFI